MKNMKLLLIVALSINQYCYAQYDKLVVSTKDLNYELHGAYINPVLKEKLNNVNKLGDLITNYPSSWIKSYASVEISFIKDGKIVKISDSNDVLNAKQKHLLKSSEIGTNVVINATYVSKNAVSNTYDNSKMSYSFTIVPDIEAEFETGNKVALNFLKEKGITIMPPEIEKSYRLMIRFTINAEGKMINANIVKPSMYSKIDNDFLVAILKLAKWKAAKNIKNENINQDFIFTVGYYGC